VLLTFSLDQKSLDNDVTFDLCEQSATWTSTQLVAGVEMYQKAKNPDSIIRKIYECQFFLVEMAKYESTLDSEKFQYCLSAFLSSFRTCAFRCYGVTEHKRGKLASHALRLQLQNHSEIGFLLSRTNVEVHEDGVVVQRLYTSEVIEPTSPRWPSRTAPEPSMRNLNKSRYGDAVIVRHAAGWRFEGNSKNLIELCHDALEAMRKFVAPVLVNDPMAG
jgi:hypothetical protein